MSKMGAKNSILLRVRIAFLFVFLAALVITFRVIEIQFIEGDTWKEKAKEINLQERTVKAVRGNIYAEDGSLLATSLPFYKIAFDPTVAADEVYAAGIDSLCHLLAAFYKDKSYWEYKKRLNTARKQNVRYLVLGNKKIDHLEKKMIARWPVFRKGRMSGGIIFEQVDLRYKPFGYLGARTVGFVNENGKGAGLEYSFNAQLAGKDGKGLFQKMAGNNWKPIFSGTEVKPEEGLDIETTININLQDVTQAALFKALDAHQADYGCAVVMEVKTGEIKAISNLSKLDNNVYAEVFNYAVGGLTEPGSTFKLASIIALLENTSLSLNDSIDAGEGRYSFYDRTMTDHKPGGYGMISVKDAFSKSSNIAISRLVNQYFGIKPQTYLDYLHAMHLDQPVGFQLIGEKNPVVKKVTDKSWSGTTLPWMSIGYELALTPLQTLTFYNAVANNGKMVRPVLVKKVKRADKDINVYQGAVLNEKICSDETLAKVKVLLESVVEEGTASNIRNTHYKIAGKTGTAKKIVDRKYTNTYYTSFAGYFPAKNPKYSCIVIIDNPKGYNQYGSDVAAPVFRTIADKIYATDVDMYKSVPAQHQPQAGVFPVIQAGYHYDLTRICNVLGIDNHSAEGEDWVRAEPEQNTIRWASNRVTASSTQKVIPDVQGMTLRDALYVLENRGVKVSYQGMGRIVRQSLLPGSKIEGGSRIYLKLE